jgi:hypothetical protein
LIIFTNGTELRISEESFPLSDGFTKHGTVLQGSRQTLKPPVLADSTQQVASARRAFPIDAAQKSLVEG